MRGENCPPGTAMTLSVNLTLRQYYFTVQVIW
jgi:hypothetical protein